MIFDRFKNFGLRSLNNFFRQDFSVGCLENAFLDRFRPSRVDFWNPWVNVFWGGLKDINFGLELSNLHFLTPSDAW